MNGVGKRTWCGLADGEEERGQLSAAGRFCIPWKRNSIITFQSRSSAMVGGFH
jgi:hypothetical protein